MIVHPIHIVYILYYSISTAVMIKINDCYTIDSQTDRQIDEEFMPGFPIHLRLTSYSVKCSCLEIIYVCPTHMSIAPKHLQSHSEIIISHPSSFLDYSDFCLPCGFCNWLASV